MRLCPRCNVTFSSQQRSYCLYCDSRLLEVEDQSIFVQKTDAAKRKILGLKSQDDMDWREYVIGNYFRTRSFAFSYAFFRNEFKKGKAFPRFWIQPLDLTFLIKLPWLAINIFDSLFFRILYTGFCPRCGWKYKQFSAQAEHDAAECAYNQEYTAVVEAVLEGKILKNEPEMMAAAAKNVSSGKKSAYRQLCARKTQNSAVIDVLTILLSMSFFIALTTAVILPLVGKIYHF